MIQIMNKLKWQMSNFCRPKRLTRHCILYSLKCDQLCHIFTHSKYRAKYRELKILFSFDDIQNDIVALAFVIIFVFVKVKIQCCPIHLNFFVSGSRSILHFLEYRPKFGTQSIWASSRV